MGKHFFIFGGTGAIGSGLKDALLADGHQVTTLGRGKNNDVQIDLSELHTIDERLEEGIKNRGVPDHIISCSALQGPIGPVWELDSQEFIKTIEVGLTGQLIIASTLLRTMKNGSLLFFSGGGAVGSRRHFTAYSVAKTGILRMVENIGLELQENGMPHHIFAVSPGPFKSPMTDKQKSFDRYLSPGDKEIMEKTMAGGGTSIETIINCVQYLCESENRKYLNGRMVHVNENYRDINQPLAEENGNLRRIDLI